MEQEKNIPYLIELIDRPAFCVYEGVVRFANSAAVQLGIQAQTAVASFLGDQLESYNTFSSGSFSCKLQLYGGCTDATITRINDVDYFILENPQDSVLNNLALAAQQLRKPLTNMIALMDSEFMRQAANSKNGAVPMGQLSKSLMQLNRQICNMSDVVTYSSGDLPMSTVGICGLFSQILEKAATLLETSAVRLEYQVPDTEVYALIYAPLIERAVYNLISNAVKFAQKGTAVYARLDTTDQLIRFSIQSTAAVEPQQVRFDMYQRSPGLEDNRYGLGLGLVLVRKTAVMHSGTVLVDKPDKDSIRITMTIPQRTGEKPTLRSPFAQEIDYSGGIDHALLELSEVLSKDCYGV